MVVNERIVTTSKSQVSSHLPDQTSAALLSLESLESEKWEVVIILKCCLKSLNFTQFLIIAWIIFPVEFFIIANVERFSPPTSVSPVMGLNTCATILDIILLCVLWETPQSKAMWRESFYFCFLIYVFQPIVHHWGRNQDRNSSRAGTWGQELKQRPPRSNT